MSNITQWIRWIFQHKKKILGIILLSLFFLFILFPYNDLSDLLTSKVAQYSQNQIFLECKEIHPSLFPQPSISLDQVLVFTPWLPTLKADRIAVIPSLMGLFRQKPQGVIKAQGLWGGEIQASIKPEKNLYHIQADAKKISLLEIHDIASLPLTLLGQVSLQSNIVTDPNLQDLNVKLDPITITALHIPPSVAQTPLGPLNLPELKLSQVQVKANFSNNQLIIENAQLGNESDELFGTIKGKLDLTIQNRGQLFTRFGGYSFDVDLKLKPSFENRAKLFLSFVDQYKQSSGASSRYVFRVSADQLGLPPSFK